MKPEEFVNDPEYFSEDWFAVDAIGQIAALLTERAARGFTVSDLGEYRAVSEAIEAHGPKHRQLSARNV